jgi:hypothetical protein
MKIKITKTIDDNQIPAEVRRMLDQYKNTLMYTMPDQMSAIVRASLSTDGTEFFSSIELLASFRQELASLDGNLNELQNVLVGYRNALTPQAPEETEEESPESLERENAEYEKLMSRIDGTGEVGNEEG